MAKVGSVIRSVLREVSVEPSLFLYMFGAFVYYPLLQNMVYSSFCDKDPHCTTSAASASTTENVSTASCGAVSSASARTSHFIFLLTLSSVLPGALTTFLFGRWSDLHGRKLLMALPAAGAGINAVVSVLTYKLNWNIHTLLAGGVVAGCMGSYAMFNQASFAYVADKTSAEHRTARLGVLEAMIYGGMALGSEIGGVWTQRNGYGPPYWGVITSQILVVVYVACFLKEVPPAAVAASRRPGQTALGSVLHGFRLFTRPDGTRRTRLVVLVGFIFATLNFNALIDVTIPYLRDEPFTLDFALIGHFLALGNFMHGLSAIVGLPLLLKLGLSDMGCIQVGLISSMASLVMLGLAHKSWLLFLVPVVGGFRGMVVPCVRASLSKLARPDEHGALFSSIAVVEIICTVLASLIYNNAYPATCSVLPSSHGFIFLLMAGCLLLPLAMFWWVGRQTPVDSPAQGAGVVQDEDGLSADDPLLGQCASG